MSNEPAISLSQISKVYKRYHRPVDRLREVLLPGKPRAEEFWALRNINLEIPQGDTVGIVGRNGSGKSTLLQIIAGTLQATSGQLQVHGRVSALLELGSGFNPEFTGRQNTFFNGRILGLSQAEIAAKFDDIAAFADIGSFMDQPVRTYSSGMFVRLAFAVAINAEPDILIVDEALSVGDEAFQRKCFARIYEMQAKGATVLFVSHSAGSIVELCDHAVLIDAGEVVLKGLPKTVIANYQKFIYAPADQRDELRRAFQAEPENSSALASGRVAEAAIAATAHRPEVVATSEAPRSLYDPYLLPQHSVQYQSRGARIKSPEIRTVDGQPANLLLRHETYIYSYKAYFVDAAWQVQFGMMIKTLTGFELGGAVSHGQRQRLDHVGAGSLIDVEFEFSCALLPGTYFLNAGVRGDVNGEDVYLDRAIDAVMFKVQPEVGLKATGTVDFQAVARVVTTSAVV